MHWQEVERFHLLWQEVERLHLHWQEVERFHLHWQEVERLHLQWQEVERFHLHWQEVERFHLHWQEVERRHLHWQEAERRHLHWQVGWMQLEWKECVLNSTHSLHLHFKDCLAQSLLLLFLCIIQLIYQLFLYIKVVQVIQWLCQIVITQCNNIHYG